MSVFEEFVDRSHCCEGGERETTNASIKSMMGKSNQVLDTVNFSIFARKGSRLSNHNLYCSPVCTFRGSNYKLWD